MKAAEATLYRARVGIPVPKPEENLLREGLTRAARRGHVLDAFRWRPSQDRWAAQCVLCHAWAFVAPDVTKTAQRAPLSGMALGLACRGLS